MLLDIWNVFLGWCLAVEMSRKISASIIKLVRNWIGPVIYIVGRREADWQQKEIELSNLISLHLLASFQICGEFISNTLFLESSSKCFIGKQSFRGIKSNSHWRSYFQRLYVYLRESLKDNRVSIGTRMLYNSLTNNRS